MTENIPSWRLFPAVMTPEYSPSAQKLVIKDSILCHFNYMSMPHFWKIRARIWINGFVDFVHRPEF
jgi:hypothetical protein